MTLILQCQFKYKNGGSYKTDANGVRYFDSGTQYSMQYSLDGGEMQSANKIQDLAPILTSIPESKFFYDRIFWGKRIRWYGLIGGVVAGGIALAISPNGSNQAVEAIGGTLLLAGLIVPRVLSSPRKDYIEAIETYNRVSAKKQPKPPSSNLSNPIFSCLAMLKAQHASALAGI